LFAKTHQLLSHHIASHIKEKTNYTFEKYTFGWSNMKPDFVPSLAVKKHYIEESFPFVVEEILSLMTTPSEDLLNKHKKKIFEAKLGVICHFVSDFFCVPHNQRWEFKHSMIPHVKYETKLEGITRNVSTINSMCLPTLSLYSKESVSLFLRELLDEYEQKKDYQRDLLYSVNVCTAVSSFIIQAVLSGQEVKGVDIQTA
jgi:Zinc dependent phospholipase C